ncbi:MAG TPA: ABC transporter ATP-binding protein [Elusimicrobia bacterium]|nr:ABC transporter ATP-binding protein [Elusimicrobiota bacterium]
MSDKETFEIELRGMSKKFGGLYANRDATLSVKKGEIHALVGENGAGKTTLMKLLYGMYRPDGGEMLLRSKQVRFDSPAGAIAARIGMVHQHFMLVKTLTVAENVVLGQEIVKAGIFLDSSLAEAETALLIKKFNLALDPKALAANLSVGEQQRLEILKILYRKADILILDEPTAVLTPQETAGLFAILKSLRDEGKTIVLITHKLKEVISISDSVTVMRQGRTVGSVKTAGTSESQLAQLMVGRPVVFEVGKKPLPAGELETRPAVLEISGLKARSTKGHYALDGFELVVKKGEIFGIAGVEGNGQSELIEIITGLKKPQAGTMKLNGELLGLANASPRLLFDKGVAHIPEDRHKRGLVLDYSVADNLVLGRHREKTFSRPALINFDAINDFAGKMTTAFNIQPQRFELPARSLSGGNQQKVVVAREFSRQPKLLIASQPTRGVDVGAIEFIHKKIIEARDAGCAVLLLSAELSEIMSLSDRIGVIYRGRVAGIFSSGEATEEQLGLLMMSGAEKRLKA